MQKSITANHWDISWHTALREWRDTHSQVITIDAVVIKTKGGLQMKKKTKTVYIPGGEVHIHYNLTDSSGRATTSIEVRLYEQEESDPQWMYEYRTFNNKIFVKRESTAEHTARINPPNVGEWFERQWIQISEGLTWFSTSEQHEDAIGDNLGIHLPQAPDSAFDQVSLGLYAGGIRLSLAKRANIGNTKLAPYSQEEIDALHQSLEPFTIIKEWNGVGTNSVSIVLDLPISPSVENMFDNYSKGCPKHNGSVFCGSHFFAEQSCDWASKGRALAKLPEGWR